MPDMTASDKKWQAESDARTLSEANTIAISPARLRDAKRAAKRLAKDAKQSLDGLLKVSKKKVNKRTTKRATPRRRR